jgi:hypothetical protein
MSMVLNCVGKLGAGLGRQLQVHGLRGIVRGRGRSLLTWNCIQHILFLLAEGERERAFAELE